MPRLTYLNVAWNQLQNIHEEISVLHKHAANLTTLDVRHNPWQKVCHVVASLYFFVFISHSYFCMFSGLLFL